MIYHFQCKTCWHDFHKEFSEDAWRVDEPCEKCHSETRKIYGVAPRINLATSFQAAYFPAFGKAFTNKRDLDYHLDKNNLVPIGNDFGSPDKMYESMEKDRESKRQADWDKTLENLKV